MKFFLMNKTLRCDMWKTMIKAKSALGNVGFSIGRLSNADYAQLMDSVKALNNPTIKNIFFQFFHTPFETREIEE